MVDEIILSAQQLKCLASPTCNSAVQALRSLGSGSAIAVGTYLGKSPATAYYHLKTLVAAGLAEEMDKRPTSRKPESIYRLSAKRFKLPNLDSDAQVLQLSCRAVQAGLRETARGLERSNPRTDRFRQVIRAQIRLSPENGDRFIELIEQASQFALEHESSEGVHLHWCSVLFSDVSNRG